MKPSIIFKSLLVASLITLGACGKDKNKNPRVANNCNGSICQVNPTGGYGVGGDYMLSSVVPMLQQYYGNIIVTHPIEMMGRTLGAGTHTWASLYQNYILPSVRSANCQITNAQPYGQQYQQVNNTMSPFGTLNYNCLQSATVRYLSIWSMSYLSFEYQRYTSVQVSFFEVYNFFLSTSSSYYANNYYPTYGGQNYYQQGSPYYQQSYCYNPYYYGYGAQNYQPYYAGNSGWYLNIGFSI